MPAVSILIVSFNTKDYLEQCLRSLFQHCMASEFEVVVVDNASNDDTLLMLHNTFPQVRVIKNTENVGFAKANNQAYALAQGDYIFLLNPDCAVEDNILIKLRQFCEQTENVGIVAPQLLNQDKSIQPSCFHLPTLAGAVQEFFLGKQEAYSKYYPKEIGRSKVEAVVGAAMFIPKKVLQSLDQFFDEKYFFYYEDIDLCRRISQTGKDIYYLPTAQVIHYHGGATSKTGEWAYNQNQKSARIYFGSSSYILLIAILKYGQKWQKLIRKIKK